MLSLCESAEPLVNIDGFGAFPSEPSDLDVAVTVRLSYRGF